MEPWELDFEWLKIRHFIKDKMGNNELPDLNAILFLIGIQELGFIKKEFSKEEKQDLMHIAVCTLLSEDGYYKFLEKDKEGWPHWEQIKSVEDIDPTKREFFLKTKIIKYFTQ